MQRLTAGLVAAILSAVPAAAIAGPDTKSSDPWDQEQTFEWMSSSEGARLGVMVMSLTPELRSYFGAPNDKGVLVAKVEPGSSAEKAGVKVGDVIVDVKGNSVDDASDVIDALSESKTGDKVHVAVVRDHKSMGVDATISVTKTKSGQHANRDWMRQMFPWFNPDPWFRPDRGAPSRG